MSGISVDGNISFASGGAVVAVVENVRTPVDDTL
jgi:hypothetical protein